MLNRPALEVPIQLGPDGSLQIGNSIVRLEEVIAEFERGRQAEEIVARFEGLDLRDVFLVLAYYLQDRKQVESYLLARKIA